MNFATPVFLELFLPAVLVGYHGLGLVLRGLPGRPRTFGLNLFLFAASVFFYAWGEPSDYKLLLYSLAANYLFGVGVGWLRQRRHPARWLTAAAVAANLGLLGWLKYSAFVLHNVSAVWFACGGPVLGELPQSHLPVGVSFFTFQAISYVLDVARGEVPAERSPLRFAVYVFLFPHLIAGPIVRYAHIAGQLGVREVGLERFAAGVRRLAVGLAKKLLLANTLGEAADEVFGRAGFDVAADQLTAGAAWLGAACYALQIYFDFGGYSDMAIGLGKMLGFDFHDNFRHPYRSASVTEFWRRWHVSLSTWFRDYLYIPLGGNRGSPLTTYRNLLVVFVLCGLWHGANWTFLVWGLWHGAFLILERLGCGRVLEKLWPPVRHAYTIVVVVVGWVFFRAETLPQAAGVLTAMAGFGGDGRQVADVWNPKLALAFPIGVVACLPVMPWLVEGKERLVRRLGDRGGAVMEAVVGAGGTLATAVLLVASAVQVVAGTYSPFIYFRF